MKKLKHKYKLKLIIKYLNSMIIDINIINHKDAINNCLLDDNKSFMTTITNYGYILYTLNMLKSLKQFDLDKKVLIVCMDKKSYNIFKKLGYNVLLIDLEMSKFISYNKKGYDVICYYKLLFIYKAIEAGYNVFYFDGDVVFTNNPLNNIDDWNKSDKDVWIQNDTMNNYNYGNMCMGVIFVKSTDNSLKYFKCDTEENYNYYNNVCAFDNNDQTYFNNLIKPYLYIGLMPLELYPNGQYFYNNPHLKETCILVHFNWVQGHEKLIKIKNYKMWLLTEKEEENLLF